MAKFIDVKLKIDTSRFRRRMGIWNKQIESLPRRALDYFIAQTPIDTGTARRRTSLERGNTIHANYPYAERLDTGWSDQAPRGMSKPTREWMQRNWRKLFKR